MKKFLILCAAFIWAYSAAAQENIQVDNLAEGISYREVSSRLSKIEKLTKAEHPDINAMVEEISYLNNMSMQLDGVRQSINDEIKVIEKRIDALGEVDEKLPSSKVIVQKQREFRRELSDEKTRLSETEILLAKIDELNMRIFEIRNQALWGNLLISTGALINPSVLFTSNQELFDFVLDIVKSPYLWYEKLSASDKGLAKKSIYGLLILVSVITFLGYWLRRFIIRQWGYRADIETPRLGRKILAAFTVWCAYGIIPSSTIGAGLWWLLNEELLTGSLFGVLLKILLYYLLYIIIGRATCRVVFTPYNERWRLINMPTDKAKKITGAIYRTIEIWGIFAFLQHTVLSQNYSLELLSYLLAISSSVKAICVVWITHIYFASDENEDDREDDNDDDMNEQEGNTFKIGMFVSLFAMAIMAVSLFGYARLASFVIDRSIISAVILAAFGILRRFIYDVVQHLLLMGLWVKTFRMRRMFLRKIDFWFGIIVEPLLLLLLIGVLLLLWGVPFDILQATVYKAVSGFTIGGIRISLISIFWGIVAFIICLWIIKFIRYRVEFKLLEKTNIDAGTKHSLASGLAYIGYVLSGLLSIAIMGGNLNNIALVAGALSVGIGLGLQDIVKNFVSGIIMLFERPIKVGDWVTINGEEGKVKQINIRSTEIETFNRASVIIPNANVLSNMVTNMTHQNNWVRYAVKVGVAYGSDVELVKKVLLECAASHPKVTKKPAPYVLFQNFGASSLDFELRFYVSDIWAGWEAPSDVRYIINRRFIEEGIEIPFNQMVVHQGSQVADKTAAQFYAKNKKSTKNADK